MENIQNTKHNNVFTAWTQQYYTYIIIYNIITTLLSLKLFFFCLMQNNATLEYLVKFNII